MVQGTLGEPLSQALRSARGKSGSCTVSATRLGVRQIAAYRQQQPAGGLGGARRCGRPLMHRIATNAELADLHAAGFGYIFNDFTSGSAGARDNVFHETDCSWVWQMLARAEPQNRPSVRKIFFATLSEALSWLASNRGAESRAWKRCATCRPGLADTGKHADWVEPVRAAPSANLSPAQSTRSLTSAPATAGAWPFPVFAKPGSTPISLPTPPRLASWNKADDPGQLRLGEYLAVADDLLRPRYEQLTGLLALRMDVGLPRHAGLLDQRDLDNYLLPLATKVRRSAPGELVCVWGTKQHSAKSFVRIERAIPTVTVPPSGWCYIIRTDASSVSSTFKKQIRDQLGDANPLPPGPVLMQLSFAVGPARNWLNLWKPVIDALGKILGHAADPDSWSPLDGRIVDLGLHCRVEPAMGNGVLIAIAAEPVRA